MTEPAPVADVLVCRLGPGMKQLRPRTRQAGLWFRAYVHAPSFQWQQGRLIIDDDRFFWDIVDGLTRNGLKVMRED